MKRSDISEEEIITACNIFKASNKVKINKEGHEIVLQKVLNTPDITLSEKYPVKVILAKMRQMVEQGKLDYGVSLRTAWVVD